MSGITALTKIRNRTKQLQKKHPGKKYRTLQKQASNEYNAGTIPKKRAAPKKRAKKRRVGAKRRYKVTHRVKKVGAVRSRRRAAPKRTKRVRTVTRTKTVYRRVGAAKSNTIPLLLTVAALGVGAYLLLKKPSVPTLPVALVPRANPSTASAANNILQYAAAAGAGIAALTALVNALNSSSDSTVQAANQQVTAGGGIPDFTGGGTAPWLA